MSKLILAQSTLALITVAVWWFWPLLKTGWLITRVTPHSQTVPGAPRLLVLGDSTGYGTGAARSNESIAGLIGADFAVTVENNSVNGRTIGELRAIAAQVKGRYEVILLQVGANDILKERAVKVVESELMTIVTTLLMHTGVLIMLSSGNVGAVPKFQGQTARRYEALSREYRAMFIQVGETTDLMYIDLFIEPALDPFVHAPATYVSLDGLHPSSAGYRLWYEKLYPAAAQVLGKKL